MKDIYYDIKMFEWDKTNRLFTQFAHNLHSPLFPYYFPNGRKQFYIKNYKTNGFRRFRYVSEKTDETSAGIHTILSFQWVEDTNMLIRDSLFCNIIIDRSINFRIN